MAKQNHKKTSAVERTASSVIRAPQAHARLLVNGYVSIKQCRHGLFMYNLNDLFISRSLDLYGEWCAGETEILGQIIRNGDVIIDVGANIGTHSVFFAKAVAPAGMVYSFEPQRITFEFLCANLALNNIVNARPFNMGAGDEPCEITVPVLNPSVAQNFGALHIEGHEKGDKVNVIPLDDLNLDRCNLIKIDVEGMEVKVLKGAEKTIRKCRPTLFVENNGQEGAPDLVQMLYDLDYVCWWQVATYYNPNNYFKNTENVWPNIVPEANMVCLPKEVKINITGFIPVIDIHDTWRNAVTRA